MTLLARIFSKDLAEFARSRELLLLVFVAPVALMLLIGNLRVREPVTRVAIVAAPKQSAQLQSWLEGLSNVKPILWPSDTQDLLSRSVRENVDIVAVWEKAPEWTDKLYDWQFYTPLTNRYRLQSAAAVVQDLVFAMERRARLNRQLGLVRKLAHAMPADPQGDASGAAPPPPAPAPAAGDARPAEGATASKLLGDLEQDLNAGGAVPTTVLRAALSNRLMTYFPPISELDRSIVPGFIALVAVFLPFLLATGALVREREAGTLETLILAARRSWARVAVGKLLLPMAVAMIVTLLLLIVARTAYGFGIKPGLAPALAVQLLAALASALLGLSISTLIKSQQDTYLTSALYLVALVLLTGMIYPIEQAAVVVVLVSYAFPLTFAGPPLEAWMTQGASAVLSRGQLAGLVAQLVVSVALCALALRRAQRSF